MNARWCHRCHAELAAHEDGTLQFCSQCGAPQIRLSEELRERAELRDVGVAADVAGNAAEAPVAPVSAFDAHTIISRDVLRFGALSAVASLALALLSAVVPPMLLIGWLWALVSPIVLLGLFHARNPRVPLSTGFGARMGIVAGLANTAAMGSVYALVLFVLRRAHVLGAYDATMQTSLRDLQAQMMAQSAAQANPAGVQLAQSLNVPEFRAGMMLGGLGLLTLLLLIVSTAGGAFAGFMRSRRA